MFFVWKVWHSHLCVFPLTVYVSLSAEPIIVEVTFKNPLKVPLALTNLSLLWTFTADDAAPSKAETEDLSITNEESLAQEVVILTKRKSHFCWVYWINVIINRSRIFHCLFDIFLLLHDGTEWRHHHNWGHCRFSNGSRRYQNGKALT